MTVSELIEELQKMPQYAPVFLLTHPDPKYRSGPEVEYVRWEGDYVLLQCPL